MGGDAEGARPLAVPAPTLLTVVAGGVAALANEGVGGLTLVKDLFVLLWAVCLANLGRDPALFRLAVRAFVRIGTIYALVMMTGFAIGNTTLSGQQPDGERLMFTFGDANYAANWFICVFFIARATRSPRRRGGAGRSCGVLIAAELLTGSNGGLLAPCCALVLGLLFRLLREGKAHHAVASAPPSRCSAAARSPRSPRSTSSRCWTARRRPPRSCATPSAGRPGRAPTPAAPSSPPPGR